MTPPSRVDRTLRENGYCGLRVDGFACMLLAGHEPTNQHTDAVVGRTFEAEMTEEELHAEPTKQREGDQVLPSGDTSLVDDQALLIQDIEWRRQVGIERYGQGHRPFNGRDTLLDLYEEQLDFLVYLRSIRRMSEATREELIRVGAKALHPEPDAEDEATAAVVVDRIMGWVQAQIILTTISNAGSQEPDSE